MTTNADLLKRKEAATVRGVGVLSNFFAARAKNAEIWDVEGNRYIDFAAGIAVNNTGHQHPAIVQAMRDQLDSFTHTCYQVVPYESYISLAEKINALVPGNFAKKTAFFSTGAEAVENAIKIARKATGRSGVIAFSGGFHGRTFLGMALTGKVYPYKAGFGPFPAEIYHAPFPNNVHGITDEQALDGLKTLLKADIEAARVAAIIIEPVQGEGGFNITPPAFMRALRALCDEYGIILIADEVQTGFARTGKLFAMEHYDVVPDLMTIAKSLAGGMPLSGVCGRAEIMDKADPGGLGGTYAGNPLAIASAHAVLDIIKQENLVERSNTLGARLKEVLNELKSQYAEISDVRGLGSMVALEFQDAKTKAPNAALVTQIQKAAAAKGLILLTCGTYANVIRFLFPLTIEAEVLEEGLAILKESVQSVLGANASQKAA